MADIQQLSYPYFTDNSTALNASNLNPIIAKINELVVKVNGGSPSPTPTPSVSTPVITINGTSATITCATSGATIYYTTNGDTPTSLSTQYSSAITLSGTGTLKAIAIKDNTSSEVASKKYTVNLFNLFNATIGNSISSSDGTLVSSAKMVLSDYVPVSPNTQYSFKGRWIVCWFDSSKNFISASPSSESEKRLLTSPANAAFVRWCFDMDAFLPRNYVMNIGATLGSDTEANQSYPSDLPNLYVEATLSENTGLEANSGNTVSSAAYSTSDYIAVTGGSYYTFWMRYNVAWYDSSKQYISGSAGANKGDTIKTLQAPTNAAYMRFSFTRSVNGTSNIVNAGTLLNLEAS